MLLIITLMSRNATNASQEPRQRPAAAAGISPVPMKKKRPRKPGKYSSLYEYMKHNIRSQRVRKCYHVYKSIYYSLDPTNFYNHPLVKKMGITRLAQPGWDFSHNLGSLDDLYLHWAMDVELKFLRDEQGFDTALGQKTRLS